MTDKLSSKDASLPNDPEAVFKKHMDYIRPARSASEKATDEAKKANGVYRATLKAAQKDGVDIKILLEVLAMQRLDPADATRNVATFNTYALWLSVPIGTQLGLGLDGRSIATQIEDRLRADGVDVPEKQQTMTEIGAAGWEAFGNGLTPNDNPYSTATVEGQRWLNDFRRAEQDAIRKATPPSADAEAAPKGRKPRTIKPPKTTPEHPDEPRPAA